MLKRIDGGLREMFRESKYKKYLTASNSARLKDVNKLGYFVAFDEKM
jgi:hypothetical protein